MLHDAADIFMKSVGIKVSTFLDTSSCRVPSMLNVIGDQPSLHIATGVENFRIFRAIVDCWRHRLKRPQNDVERNVLTTLLKLKHELSFSLVVLFFSISACPRYLPRLTATVSLLGTCLSAALTWPISQRHARVGMGGVGGGGRMVFTTHL